ncbi:ribonuclease III [Marinobacterium sediminicola]|uniref:Ribonuclease 3 n=1 Tax=Marinobacterium sediminicola TaxID=518898 RepID=A0ABY1RZJ8_9GAMM|nr:ribonuclease III [Marinobacterium sediminicola]ULG69918.1 ribonuclease III [Marinobacterium sediminicola]SMR74367.1 RNAse III [Marinobacterium sediminicola]
MIKPAAELARKLGNPCTDNELFELALTHRSCGKRNNERLEFLGDAILSFVIADDLYQRFPAAREGQMSRLRSRVVKGETLAKIAREMQLGDYLRLGSGELKSGGYRRDSILADSVEAIIGAVYLDQGIEAARRFILHWFAGHLDQLDLNISLKDAKTRLQEFLQSRRVELPRYELVSVEGDPHDQTFHIRCDVVLLEQPTEGRGSSRRQAEQEAARRALKTLGQETGA